MGNNITTPNGEQNAIYDRHTLPRIDKSKLIPKTNAINSNGNGTANANTNNPENSRVLFLLYLIQRTFSLNVVDNNNNNNNNNSNNSNNSNKNRHLSYCFYEMAPSAGQNMSNEHLPPAIMNDPWNQQNQKENQRPPVFFPEDYVTALKKFSKFGGNSANLKSIYDTSDDIKVEKITNASKSRTLPSSKNSEYRSPIIPADSEMTLRQFGSITDLLTKLRADLRTSFPSFVQEFITSPMDGVSLLLEVLRAVQLSQNTITGSSTLNSQNMELRNNQSYQRRALLDELSCLQCLSICCSRSSDASTRLGSSPVGLLPLACSATGTGIRSRILALQLLTMSCDKHTLGDHVPQAYLQGHQAVSEALSTLRLRCAEPVRFRLMIGILNSGGGSGELQTAGLRFINTFMESAESLQTRLYLQAELFQAGLEPCQLSKLISSTSPWMDKLMDEICRWDSIKIDIEGLQKEVRTAEQCRSKLVILERKIEMLQEEKVTFTSIERRLQEKCGDLQRELMQLKKNNSHNVSLSSTLEKRPVALPRQMLPTIESNKHISENEDEGISSSETGQSTSPIPPDYVNNKTARKNSFDDDSNTTIDDVIEELTNIVNDAEREISENPENFKPMMKSKSEHILTTIASNENEIIPVNLHPQPPRKSNKSLIHIFGPQHNDECSDYDLYYTQENLDGGVGGGEIQQKDSLYENDYELTIKMTEEKYYHKIEHQHNHPDLLNTTQQNSRQQKDDNRQILNVIMDAREKEQKALLNRAQSLERDMFPPQQFNGVFFMSDMMNHTNKFPKPDIMAALEAKRVSKTSERRSSSNCGVDSMIDIVMTVEQQQLYQQSRTRQIFHPSHKNGNSMSNFKFKNTNVNPGLFHDQPLPRDHRTHSNISGAKVTDILSGLY
ncbi:unnamed protein product [Diamesa serratosioi]